MIHTERDLAGVTLDGSSAYTYPAKRKFLNMVHDKTEYAKNEELATVGIMYNEFEDITENMIRAEHGLHLRVVY